MSHPSYTSLNSENWLAKLVHSMRHRFSYRANLHFLFHDL